MKDFMFHLPTKVYFGREADKNIGQKLRPYNASRVLILYGGGSVKRTGLLQRVEKDLEESGLTYVEMGGVEPNPKVQLVRQAMALCLEEKVDFVLAVGGGSVLDTAKAVAVCVASDVDPWDLTMKKATATATIPVGVVLTLAATGSEVSNAFVLNNPDVPKKKGCLHELLRPAVAFLNPENTYTVSPYQTACGVVDAMMHTMERYYSRNSGTELIDRIGEGILATLKHQGRIALEQPDNYEARANIMWAATLSISPLTLCGKDIALSVVHQLENGISGLHDRVAHGAGLSVLYPAWAKYICKYDVRRFCQLAVRVWDIPMDFEHPEQVALAGIEAMKDYFRSLGMPVTMQDLDIGPEDYETMAQMITAGGTYEVPSYIPLGKKEILDIFRLAEN